MIGLPIKCKRTLLRELCDDDARAMLAYRSDPLVTRYQSWKPHGIDEVHAFIAENRRNTAMLPGSWYQIAIAQLGDTMIGDMGLHTLDDRCMEIGITIAPAFQRNGFATEALHAILDRLFREMQKQRAIASIDPRNNASIALMQRLGFHLESEEPGDMVFALSAAGYALRPQDFGGEGV